MKNSEYWKERFQQMENARHESSAEKIIEIQEQINKAQHAIEEKINAWYQRFADNNNLSLVDAQKLLNSKELKEFKWDVKDYIKYGKENALNQQWMKELENASARVHISRLEQIKLQTQQYAEVAFGSYNDILDNHIKDLYKQEYYHTAFEIQKGIGVGYSFAGVNEDKLEKVISKPWASDGANFSDRIWTNKQKLVNQLHTSLTQMCITGEGPDRAIKEIAKAMGSSKYQAGRLVMTESAYFGSQAQKECFDELDVEKYEIVATLDSHTSDICQEMDGKVFKMSEYEAGVTAPPFHVNCRSCTCPHFDDEFAGGKRAARGEDGKTYHVAANMTYKEWKEKVVKEKDSDIIKSGAISGARNPHGESASKHAEKYYGLVRSMTTDVGKIAKITGYSEKEIQEIKNFIFIDKHDLGGDELEYFKPDYMMSESWRRLMQGTPEEHDLTLIKHEIMEKDLMKKGFTQEEAHNITSKVYNYDKEANEFYGKIKKYKKE